MMFEHGQCLGDDGIRTAGKLHNRAKIVLQLRMVVLPRIRGSKDGYRLAGRVQIPAAKVKKMDRFFQDPVADALDVVPPPVGPQPIGPARKLDEHVQRRSDGPVVDQLFGPAPKRREPQFMTDRQQPLAVLGQANQVVALSDGKAHRLLQQHVLARLHAAEAT